MIGLLQVLFTKPSGCQRLAARGRVMSFALVASLVSPSVLSAQFDPANLGDPQQFRNRFQNQQEEEPEPKPTLAERNNITPKPLMTLKEEKEFAKTRQFDYPSALRSKNPNKSEEDTIIAGVRDRAYRLTIPENWISIANLRFDLVSDIERIAGDDHPRTRALALNTAVKYLTELLADQPYIVKLNAVLLLGELNEKNADILAKIPAKPYAPAAEPLVQVLQSSDQSTDVKVVALIGLRRILKDGRPSRSVRDQAAKVMVDELKALMGPNLPGGQAWYEERLIETLGMIGEPRNAIQQPLVVDALWEAMLNETLPWRVRTQAARSLSQLDLDGSFNVGLLAHEIVKLCGQMTVQFNNQPQLPEWRECFTDLYFAFNAQDQKETEEGWGLRKQVEAASLRNHGQLVNGAYDQVLNMVNGAVGNDPAQKVARQTLTQAVQWMRANPPSDQKLHPDAKTVDAIQKAHAPQGDPSTAVSQKDEPANGT